MRLEIKPDGWECTLENCPPGLFMYNEELCFKTEYGAIEAYCDTGEKFWGGCSDETSLAKLKVQPLKYEWVEL